MGFYSSYYTYGLPIFLAVVVALYLLFTGAYAESTVTNAANLGNGLAWVNRFRRSVQCWSILGGDESVCLGVAGNWLVYRTERAGSRMVCSFRCTLRERTHEVDVFVGASSSLVHLSSVEAYELPESVRRILSGASSSCLLCQPSLNPPPPQYHLL